jgi:hypothetical protein
MRNRYLAVASTYRRPMFLLLIVPIALRTFVPFKAIGMYEMGTQMALLFFCLGAAMSVHLKETLGSPTSRVAPNLVGPHLTVAGVVAAVFTIGVPLALSFGPGFHGSQLAVVAFALAAFSFSAFVVHWMPAALRVLIVVPLFLFAFDKPDALALPLAAKTSVALAASLTIGLRYRRFNEEMFEYDRRYPPTGFGRRASPSANKGGWTRADLIARLLPLPRDLRSIAKPYPVAQEMLWQRSSHWDAGWRCCWGATLPAVCIGAILLLDCIVFPDLFQFLYGDFTSPIPVPMISLFALFAVMGRWWTNRGPLINEFLRPYSRRQQIQTVGFVLAAATAIAFASMSAALLSVVWIASSNAEAVRSVGRELVLAAGALPFYFGLAAWPFRKATGSMPTFLVLIVMLPSIFVRFSLTSLPDRAYFQLVCALLVLGCGMTWLTYRRWLDSDLV